MDEDAVEEEVLEAAQNEEKELNKRQPSKSILLFFKYFLIEKGKDTKKSNWRTPKPRAKISSDDKARVERKFTQRDFLKKAVETENDNKRQLIALLMLQEEKKSVLQSENKIKQPMIKYKMNKLGTLISFPEQTTAKYIEIEKSKEPLKKKATKRKKKPEVVKSEVSEE